MNTRRITLACMLAIVALVAILAPVLFAGTVTEPTTFRDRVVFRGSTGPDFDADNKFSIGGTKVETTAAELNALGDVADVVLTNVVPQTAALSGALTRQTATLVITNVVDGETNIYTITYMTNATVSVAGVVTNVGVQR